MPASVLRTSTATFTPAAAAYSAVDIMDAAKEFTGFGPLIGGATGLILTSSLLVSETALQASEATYTLHLYSVTPPSAFADNGAWDLPAGDRASYLGKLALGTPVDLGSSLWVEVNNIFKPAKTGAGTAAVPNSGSVWGYLVTDAGFTATATARKVTLTTRFE